MLVRFLFKILFLLISLEGFSQASTCINADFEMGNFTGWQGQLGNCCPIITNPSSITNGRHTIMSGTGTDPNTCGNVPVVAPGGNYSARLGNSSAGRQAEKLMYTMVVSPSNALFIYKYAVVLEDPSHTTTDQPRFQIRILNSSGSLVDPVCGEYTVVSSGNIPGFQTCNGNIRYKNWTTVGLDLTPYIGQSITIEFATGDCDLGAHFGYAYVDAYCSPLEISSSFCTGSLNAILSAPIGFNYLWNTGDTTQSINVNNPTTGSVYTCQLTSVTGCIVNISTILQPVDPQADFNIINNCFYNIDFSSSLSFTPANTSFVSYHWDFGDGTTSSSSNPNHVYASAGNYNVTLTVTNSAGCTNFINHIIIVEAPPTAAISYSSPSFCSNNNSIQMVNLSGTGNYNGGLYSSSAGLNINSATGAINPSLSSPGNYLVSYSIIPSVNCTIVIATTIVTITVIPTASISYSTPVCNNVSSAQQVNLTGTGTYLGGGFSSSSGLSINSINGSVLPISSSPGNYLINYTIPPFDGCTSSIIHTNLLINPNPQVAISDGIICKDLLGNTFKSIVLDTGLSGALYTFSWTFNGNPISNYFYSSYTASQVGIYNVIATNLNTGCASLPATANVTASFPATDSFAYVSNNFSENAEVTVIVQSGTGPFLFQLDEGSFQSSNVFSNVSPGPHIVYIQDENECTNITTNVLVLNYHNYFSPNGDSFHDTWNIIGLETQPNAVIRIFDRYGKFLKQIKPNGPGWDGIYNGNLMPSTDYWFEVDYFEKDSSGSNVLRKFKSHFSLLR